MPINPSPKFLDNLFRYTAAQKIQDALFRVISIQKKLKLASDFYHFAMKITD